MRPREFLNQVHAWMLFEEQNVSNCYVFRDVSVKFLKKHDSAYSRMVKCTFAFQRFVASAMSEMSTMRPLNRQSPKAKAGASGASGASGAQSRMNLAFPLRALVERINVNDDPAWAACMSPDIIRAERAERSARTAREIPEVPREIPTRAELPRLLGARLGGHKKS